jgi:hypothetical protein
VAREERGRALDGSKQGPLGESVELPAGVSLVDGADLLAGGLPDTAMMESFDEFAAQDTALDPAAFAAIAGDTAKNDAVATMPVNGDISKPGVPGSSNEQASSTAVDGTATVAVDTSAAAVDANDAFDFESMFGEGANAQPFDLDFGDAGTGNDGSTAGINMDDLFNEIGASTSDFADLGASSTSAADGGGSGTAEDLESLLPGLGSYVNVETPNAAAGGAGDDFTMIDLPAGTSSTDAASSGAATSTAAAAANTTTAGAQDGSKTTADANDGNSAGDGATNTDGGAGGEMANMDEIFGEMLDVDNMDGTSLDDFDWNL